MQPPLPDGSVPGTRPYVPAQPAPHGHLPGSPQQSPQSNLAAGALALSLLLCFGLPALLVGVAIMVPNNSDAFDAMLWCSAVGAVFCVGSLILAIIALASIRRSAGRTAMGVAAIVFSLLAPVTTLATLAMGLLLMAGGGAVHGRPLRRRDGSPAVTPDVGGDGWTGTDEPSVAGLDPELRAELARGWLDDAALEHASIAAFGKLALDLVALGAPPALLAGAHRAALEEVEHARIAYTFASIYAGAPRSAGALPEAAVALERESRADRVARVVFESIVDGVVGEAAAARVASLVAARTDDPVVAAALERIAREEATHAALAEAVVAWCAALEPDAARVGDDRATRVLRDVLAARDVREGGVALPGRATRSEVDGLRRAEARRALARLDAWAAAA